MSQESYVLYKKCRGCNYIVGFDDISCDECGVRSTSMPKGLRLECGNTMERSETYCGSCHLNAKDRGEPHCLIAKDRDGCRLCHNCRDDGVNDPKKNASLSDCVERHPERFLHLTHSDTVMNFYKKQAQLCLRAIERLDVEDFEQQSIKLSEVRCFFRLLKEFETQVAITMMSYVPDFDEFQTTMSNIENVHDRLVNAKLLKRILQMDDDTSEPIRELLCKLISETGLSSLVVRPEEDDVLFGG